MELEVLDLSVCCRLCLRSCSTTEDSSSLDDADLADRLNYIFHRSFCDSEWFPRSICGKCDSLVKDFYTFAQLVHRNQDYLESLELPGKTEEFEVDFEQVEESESTQIEKDHEANESFDEAEKKHAEKVTVLNDQDDSDASSELVGQTKSQKEDALIKQYYRIQCEICFAEYDAFTDLLTHFRDNHGLSGYIKCCDKKLYRRCRLLEHISKHLDPETFRCELCNKNYSCKTSLELHNMHQHLPQDQKPFKCSKCPRSFVKKYQLKAHSVRHVAVECPVCGKIMSSRLSLRDHMLKMHGESGRLMCDTCGAEFRSKVAFDRHLQKHQGVSATDSDRAQCEQCQKWFSTKLGLRQHIKTQHTELGEQFVCSVCGKVAPNSAALRQHKSVTHSEQKHECEFCGKRFRRAISLKEHRATHTGEVLYSCKMCSMTFNSNANMYKHQKKVHPEEWSKNRASKR